MDFGDKLKQVRTQLKLSQEGMARELGIAFPTFNNLENKKRQPSLETQRAFDAFCEKKGIKAGGKQNG